ncbi:hypothetical protein Sbal195_0594 [Shewanella baltica OS195]|uniref:H repeat-associated protein N-terminal domain-containing protein n=1 Tax=Shewanella baltica (strain OS195) TaxID=399599 RepID=A9KZL3_SHEB9|nr:hypothetical protein Sbal195_0594 [Shewanella baltica OS195]
MSLFDHLSLVEDTRSHINQRHNLVDVLFLMLSVVASGQDGWAEIQQLGELKLEWLRKFRPFANGISRRHTITRILKAVGPEICSCAYSVGLTTSAPHLLNPSLQLMVKHLEVPLS